MLFDYAKLKRDYEQNKPANRELHKYLFSITTFGLGALYLWSSTKVIKEGEVGLRQDARGNMILLPPGRHSNFPWESYPAEVQNISNPVIKLGKYKIITVEAGYVAKTVKGGEIVMLTEGQHLLDDANHVFAEMIPVKQETKRLEQVTAYTKNNVEISLYADVRYKITEPDKALKEVDNIEQSIKEISEIELSKVIGHHDLDELIPAASGMTARHDLHTQEAEVEDTGLNGVVDELMGKLGEMLKMLGIQIITIGIKSWTINDKSLAHELAQGAVVNSQTTAKVLTAERDANITTIKAQAEADAELIRAEGFRKAGAQLADQPQAFELARLEAQRAIVEAAPNASLFYGTTGNQGFFMNPAVEPQSKKTDQAVIDSHQHGPVI